jgi:hypothetical protein
MLSVTMAQYQANKQTIRQKNNRMMMMMMMMMMMIMSKTTMIYSTIYQGKQKFVTSSVKMAK